MTQHASERTQYAPKCNGTKTGTYLVLYFPFYKSIDIRISLGESNSSSGATSQTHDPHDLNQICFVVFISHIKLKFCGCCRSANLITSLALFFRNTTQNELINVDGTGDSV